MIRIGGIQNTTLLDYPEKVAATVFLGGCNFRCPFCHNADIVLNPTDNYEMSELMTLLKKRKNVLDGVCVTGGEPTLNDDLPELLYRIKEMGYSVKLDTNGTSPAMLERLYDGNLIDYVAMDIKSSAKGYAKAVGIAGYDITPIISSISMIMESTKKYEFRTTLVKGIHTLEDMSGIGELIRGAKAYYLQNYKDSDMTICKCKGADTYYESFSKEEMNKFLETAAGFSNAYIRGVD